MSLHQIAANLQVVLPRDNRTHRLPELVIAFNVFNLGPVVSREHYLKIRGYLVQAREENAVFHTGDVPDPRIFR
jgi:hypothetical protein